MSSVNTEKCCCCVEIPEVAEPLKPQEKFSKKLSDFVKKVQPIVELVCRVALAVFAAILNLKLFAITAGIGVAIGVVYTVYKNIVKEPIEVGLARPSCAQGFFDYLSGIRCPAIVSTVITAVFIGGHMHHSPFYIAFCGVPFGVWVGSQVAQVAWNLTYRDIYPMRAPLKSISDVFAPLPGQREVI